MPGETGIWVLVTGDLLLFSLFFIVLLVYRTDEIRLFANSQQSLNQVLGSVNTLLLLTSSLFVALAVKTIRTGSQLKRAAVQIAIAATLGAGFVVVKAFEWSARFAAGQSVSTNDFFMFYFMYTGIHLIHVLLGIVVLAVMYFTVRRASALDQTTVRMLEGGGIFWHLVDLLWVMLFALFYLLR